MLRSFGPVTQVLQVGSHSVALWHRNKTFFSSEVSVCQLCTEGMRWKFYTYIPQMWSKFKFAKPPTARKTSSFHQNFLFTNFFLPKPQMSVFAAHFWILQHCLLNITLSTAVVYYSSAHYVLLLNQGILFSCSSDTRGTRGFPIDAKSRYDDVRRPIDLFIFSSSHCNCCLRRLFGRPRSADFSRRLSEFSAFSWLKEEEKANRGKRERERASKNMPS